MPLKVCYQHVFWNLNHISSDGETITHQERIGEFMDDELESLLSALVDGLSGALCVIVLLTVAFIVTTDELIKATTESIVNKEHYLIDRENKFVLFRDDAVELSKSDINFIKNEIKNSKDIYFVFSNKSNSEKAALFNYATLSNRLSLGKINLSRNEKCPVEIKYCLSWK